MSEWLKEMGCKPIGSAYAGSNPAPPIPVACQRGPGDTAPAMAKGAVEVRHPVVRKALAAFDDDADAFRDALHPDIEWYPIETDRRPFIGIEAAMRDRQEWLDTWDEHRLDVEEVIEDGDSVVALIHLTGRGRFSGVAVDVRFY